VLTQPARELGSPGAIQGLVASECVKETVNVSWAFNRIDQNSYGADAVARRLATQESGYGGGSYQGPVVGSVRRDRGVKGSGTERDQ
jgi:hypothetical protein